MTEKLFSRDLKNISYLVQDLSSDEIEFLRSCSPKEYKNKVSALRSKFKRKTDPEYRDRENKRKREQERVLYDMNIKEIKFMQYGDLNADMKCQINGFSLIHRVPKYDDYVFSGTLHHVLFNREQGSVLKSEDDPGRLLRKKNIKKPSNQSYLLEMLGCVMLSLDAHKVIHSTADKHQSGTGDITMLNRENWPWALQNARNFDSVKRRYNLSVSYKAFVVTLKA